MRPYAALVLLLAPAVAAAVGPDLEVDHVTVRSTSPNTLTVRYGLSNAGDADAGPFDVAIDVFVDEAWTRVETTRWRALPAGGAAEGGHDACTGFRYVGRLDVRVTADVGEALADPEREDNVGTARHAEHWPFAARALPVRVC